MARLTQAQQQQHSGDHPTRSPWQHPRPPAACDLQTSRACSRVWSLQVAVF